MATSVALMAETLCKSMGYEFVHRVLVLFLPAIRMYVNILQYQNSQEAGSGQH